MYRRPASCAERRRYRITLEAAIGQGEHFFPSDNRRLARLIWLWHTLHHCCRSYWVGYAGLGVSRGVTHTYTQRLHTAVSQATDKSAGGSNTKTNPAVTTTTQTSDTATYKGRPGGHRRPAIERLMRRQRRQ